jgi:hypothetical protein
VAGAVLATVAMIAVAPGASAWGNPEVKRVKRALVSIEDRIDVSRLRYRSLMDRAALADSRIEDAHLTLSGRNPGESGLLGLITRFGRLGRALYDRDALIRHLAETKEEVRRLKAGRARLIKELEKLVRESRIRNAGFSPSWSVSGTLITYSADWGAVAMCESSGRWHIDSQYDGGLQFDPDTWIGFGGGEFARYAHRATKMQQIAVAERVLAIQGERAWPKCFRHLPAGF